MLSIYGSWYGYELPLAERLTLAAQAGFEGILLWWSDEYDRPDYRSQPEIARQAGLYVENIHAPFVNINHIWADTPDGQTVFEQYLRCVDDCAAFEIPVMVMHPNQGPKPPPANLLGFSRFGRLVERAEHRGVSIAIENLRTPAQVGLASLLLRNIPSPHFGLCFDSGHHNARLSRDPDMDLLRRWGHRLMALHLHDNDGPLTYSRDDDQHRLPFDGTIDWAAQMQAIADTGYRGPTSLEVVHRGDEQLPPEEFLALAYTRAKRLHQLR